MVRGIMMQTGGQHRVLAHGSRESRTLQAPKEKTAFLRSSPRIARISRLAIFRPLPGDGAVKAAADAEGALIRSPKEDSSDFSFEATVPAGWLVVAPLSRNTMRGASVVLTRAFAASEERTPISDVQEFLEELVKGAEQQVLLVASLFPTDASLLGPGQSSRVVGTVSLSFSRDTRETFLTLQPPDDATYLSNMSVDPNLRRQGIAREMLAACESFITSRNYSRDVHLHVNASNKDAQALYASQGWAIVDQDGPWVRLAGRIPVVLMKKTYVA